MYTISVSVILYARDNQVWDRFFYLARGRTIARLSVNNSSTACLPPGMHRSMTQRGTYGSARNLELRTRSMAAWNGNYKLWAGGGKLSN